MTSLEKLKSAIVTLYGQDIADTVMALWEDRMLGHSDDYRIGWLCGAADMLRERTRHEDVNGGSR